MGLVSDYLATTGLIPPGVILPFAGLSAPSGYLICDGTEQSRTTYSALFSALSMSFTANANGTTTLSSVSPNPLTAGVKVGMPISGTGFSNPSLTLVMSVTASTIVLSNSVSTATGITIYVCPYGVGNGSTTFNPPDLRGRFVRYTDSMFNGASASRDASRVHGSAQSQATARNGLDVSITGINQSSTVSVSGSGTYGSTNPGDHSHGIGTVVAAGGSDYISKTAGPGTIVTYTSDAAGGHTHSTTVNLNSSGSAVAQSWAQSSSSWSGDSETRPINISAGAIIKY